MTVPSLPLFLDVTDVDFNNQTFRVIRKGGNEAYIYFGDDIRDALSYYLGYSDGSSDVDSNSNTDTAVSDEENAFNLAQSPRSLLLKEDNPDEPALFLSLRGNRMAVRSIEVMVKKYCTMINTNKRITPHKLRST